MEDNKVIETQNEEEEEEDDDDALSLCDLPYTTHQSKEENEKDDNTPPAADDSDFIFCSVSKEPEMCAADDVFYQGRILPYCDNIRSASSSEDRFSSGGPITSSGGEQPKPRVPANKVRLIGRRKSSKWDIFRAGLLISQPAEIDFQDLKNRYHRNSRNCSEKSKKKMKRRKFLIGGCRCCASDAVDAVRTKIKRRDGESEVPVGDEVNLLGPKNRLPDNPTFEWLKHLSLQAQSR